MARAEKYLATPLEDATAYLPPSDTHLIDSKYVVQSFRIQVMQPLRRKGEKIRFPVVYATDGNFSFDVLRGISLSMQTAQRDTPRFILVGIGYPHDSPWSGSLLRARDLTFPRYPKLSTRPPVLEGVLTVPAGTPDFYGAENFQRFIQHELVPFIDERYDTISGDRTYFGHSAGGGFGLFTLFTKPGFFNRYVISSPGLIYHGESSAGIRYENYDFVPQYARSFIVSGEPLRDTRLFMSVGAEEEFEPDLVQWRLTSSFYQMAALMKSAKIPGLTLTTEVFQRQTHMTVWPMSFIHGIQAVFRAEGK